MHVTHKQYMQWNWVTKRQQFANSNRMPCVHTDYFIAQLFSLLYLEESGELCQEFGGVSLSWSQGFDKWKWAKVDAGDQLNTFVFAAKKARQ